MPLSYSLIHAQAVVDHLYAAGIRDIIYCPGSRNAPFAQVLGAGADRRPYPFRIHSRIDERAAAFLALGLGRAGRPAAVITTSGTAAANCLPAVIEAHYANIPLIIISADRPEALIDTGASQTIRQPGLFGDYAYCINIADTSSKEDFVEKLAVLSQWKHHQVHINVHADMPLIEENVGEEIQKHAESFCSTIPAFPPIFRPGSADFDYGTVTIDRSKNTLVIAGDGAWEVPGLEELPTIAEPTAPAPFNPVHPLAAQIFAAGTISRTINEVDYVVDTRPEQIIIIGHPTLHRQVMALINDPEITLYSLSRQPYITDPANRAIHGTHVKVTGEPDSQWLKITRGATEVAINGVRSVLEDKNFGFTGLHVAAAVADTLGDSDAFFIGASNPVRDCSLIGLPFMGVETYSPRGAAGIDGTVSQAVGMALAVQTRNLEELRPIRSIALMGDITFLHDAGSINNPAVEDLTIVVVNDNGGSIFQALEPGRILNASGLDDFFAMPQDVNIEALATAYGCEYARAESVEELAIALEDSLERPSGIRIIEAIVTRETRTALHDSLSSKVRMP